MASYGLKGIARARVKKLRPGKSILYLTSGVVVQVNFASRPSKLGKDNVSFGSCRSPPTKFAGNRAALFSSQCL